MTNRLTKSNWIGIGFDIAMIIFAIITFIPIVTKGTGYGLMGLFGLLCLETYAILKELNKIRIKENTQGKDIDRTV